MYHIHGGIKIKTYNHVFLEVRKRLREAGIEAFDLEARLIAVAVSGKTKEQFMRDRHLYVPDDSFENAAEDLLQRRISGEPIAYILGEWEFFGLPVNVNHHVLIPRVDTEVLVDAVRDVFRDNLDGIRVLDMCAGTGCVGLAIAANLPFCRVLLADKSQEALKISRSNTMKNNLTRRVTSIELDALEAPPMLLGLFDIIVCNPPYIPTDDLKELDPSVREFEPAMALDGGPDGLRFYRSIVSEWKSVLKDKGLMAFECGVGQADSVQSILEQNGFTDIKTYKDSLNIDRVIIGTYHS
ncbi:MAG: peptide chain release factor N(5)-glutamine methyltransferase [Clostridiales bacterium]|nr:peptide chain release factor N(5)-glutamine methyltransferase [Clostridiales bacterium]